MMAVDDEILSGLVLPDNHRRILLPTWKHRFIGDAALLIDNALTILESLWIGLDIGRLELLDVDERLIDTWVLALKFRLKLLAVLVVGERGFFPGDAFILEKLRLCRADGTT